MESNARMLSTASLSTSCERLTCKASSEAIDHIYNSLNSAILAGCSLKKTCNSRCSIFRTLHLFFIQFWLHSIYSVVI